MLNGRWPFQQRKFNMKNKSKKLSVSIGIPAYFAEKNIKNVLQSLVTQNKKNQTIKEILIYSDGSTDKTVKYARLVKDKRIKVIDAKKRKGMIAGLFKMFEIYKGDVFVLLNDDIKIIDKNVIDNLILPMKKNKNVSLVGGNPRPLPAKSLIERASISAFTVYDKTRYKFRNGENKYTCDGKIMALRRNLVSAIDKTKSTQTYGCVDVYIYFACIANKFTYKYARNAQVWFKMPNTVKDFISLTARNNANIYILEKTFGNIVNTEYSIPKKYLYTEKLKELLTHPIPSLSAFILGLYCNFLAYRRANNFQVTWDIVTSTKNLD